MPRLLLLLLGVVGLVSLASAANLRRTTHRSSASRLAVFAKTQYAKRCEPSGDLCFKRETPSNNNPPKTCSAGFKIIDTEESCKHAGSVWLNKGATFISQHFENIHSQYEPAGCNLQTNYGMDIYTNVRFNSDLRNASVLFALRISRSNGRQGNSPLCIFDQEAHDAELATFFAGKSIVEWKNLDSDAIRAYVNTLSDWWDIKNLVASGGWPYNFDHYKRSCLQGKEYLVGVLQTFHDCKPLTIIPITLPDGWGNYENSRTTYTVEDSLCTVSGVIKHNQIDVGGGGQHRHLATLPAECRPSKTLIFGQSTGGTAKARVDVSTNGGVTWKGGGSGWISLTGITFTVKGAQRTNVPLVNSWINHNIRYTSYAPSTYTVKDSLCTVSGLIVKNDRQWGHLANLPLECRPSKTLMFSVITQSTAQARVDVSTDGKVTWIEGAKAGWISLTGITFTVEGAQRTNVPVVKNWVKGWGPYAPPTYTVEGSLCTVSGWINYGGGGWGDCATLPLECRPSKKLIFSVNTGRTAGSFGRLDVTTYGKVTWKGGGQAAGWISLTGITFTVNTNTIQGGDGFIQMGDWRLGTKSFYNDPSSSGNTNHFVINDCVTGNTAQIFRSDGTAHPKWSFKPPARTDWSLCDAALSLDGKPTDVTSGDGYIEFAGVWRIGNIDNNHLSIAHKDANTGITKTAMIWRKDGTRHPGPRTGFSPWIKSTGGQVRYGDRFLQFGSNYPSFRFYVGEQYGSYSSIAIGKNTAVAYRGDGTIRGGPRTDFQSEHKPSLGNLEF